MSLRNSLTDCGAICLPTPHYPRTGRRVLSQGVLSTVRATADALESHAAPLGVGIATVNCVKEKQLCGGRFGVEASSYCCWLAWLLLPMS